MRRLLGISTALVVTSALVLLTAAPALACGGLVAPNGTVRLLRTSTLAAYADGVEHYVTSFEFAGGGAEFGSIIPLPAVPSNVERGGDWTLQRLNRETQPQPAFAAAAARDDATTASEAEVVYDTRIDALDITILTGGGREVGKWAIDHGFQLTPDAPEVLDFYSRRSPVFMAARFNADAARERGQQNGDGTPIHLTIPTKNPWVPLRILGLGRGSNEPIEADVYLLTERKPSLLRPGNGLETFYDDSASTQLLDDLRADKGMEWMPNSMWLTGLRVGESAGELRYDLAVDASGKGRPSLVDAGLAAPKPKPKPKPPTTTSAAPTTAAPTTVVAVEPAPTTVATNDVALPLRPVSDDGPLPTGIVVVSVAFLFLAAGASAWAVRRVR